MLNISLTEHGTGFKVSGDFWDFKELSNLFGCSGEDPDDLHPGFSKPFNSLFNEINKAKSGMRGVIGLSEIKDLSDYYFFNFDCIWFCACIAIFKNSKAYHKYSLRKKAVIRLVFALIHEALAKINPGVADKTIKWMEMYRPFGDDYNTLMLDQVFAEYVSDKRRTAKSRVQRLPICLEMLLPSSYSYNLFYERHKKEYGEKHGMNELLNFVSISPKHGFFW
ncbi:MAG: DUF6904 family protein [bacterium]